MNGSLADLAELDVIGAAATAASGIEVRIALPATLIDAARRRARGVAIGGQDCHVAPDGAHTGGVSAQLLRDAGASFVLLGHSETRHDLGDDDILVGRKIIAAQSRVLDCVLCVGETAKERGAGHAADIVARQMRVALEGPVQPARLAIAYEPLWAIGRSCPATVQEISDVLERIVAELHIRFGADAPQVALLYGGSVDRENVQDLVSLPIVDGVLVGRASLRAEAFVPLMQAVSAERPQTERI